MKTILAYNFDNSKIIVKHFPTANLFTVSATYLDVELEYQSFRTHDEAMILVASLIKSPHTKEEEQ